MKYQTLLAALLLVSSAAAAGGKGQDKGAKDAAKQDQQQQQQQQQQGNAGKQGGNKNKGNKNGGNNNNSASQSAAAASQSADAASASGAAASASGANGAAATDANNGGGGGLSLDPNNVQKASQQDGLNEGGAAKGQAASDTDKANFINFCTGKTLTNGIQFAGGSCNGIPMGEVPSQDNMVSGIITSPGPLEDLPENKDITMVANYKGIQLGTFTNPDATYYAAPQKLNKNGQIIGHTHFTVQNMNNDANAQQALDPVQFDFFKGVDGPADNKGNVAVTIQGGLPAGTYRVCLMSSAANHQAVTMPVAQRGAQDDCQRFTVGKGNGGNGGNAAASSAAAAQASNSADAGGAASASSADAAQATGGNNAKQNGKNNKGNKQQQQQGQKNQQQGGNKQGGGKKGGKGQGNQQRRSSRFSRHARQF